jgi:1-acyl-sn-glycerol-3-phosphate acyltransferase
MGQLGPLIPDESSRVQRLVRRGRNISIELLMFLLVTVLLPVLLVVAAVVDLALWLARRKPWMAVRLILMMWWFLAGEVYGLLSLLRIWVLALGRDSATRRDRLYRLKRRWLGSHVRGLKALFGLRFEIEGLALAGPGPILLMTRHASIIDNTLPDVIVGGAHRMGFRFVIKRELQMLPTIDIGGRWIPTLFIRRASGDTASELAKMQPLFEHLGPFDGLMIYPEGTRCTDEKLARAKEIIAERQPEIAALAEPLRHLLPPRLGGTVAMLEGARDAGADVIVFGHVGLDGFEYISDIWAGGLVGTTVRLQFWRYPASEVPADRDELIEWLYARWLELDEWVGSVLSGGGVKIGGKARS